MHALHANPGQRGMAWCGAGVCVCVCELDRSGCARKGW